MKSMRWCEVAWIGLLGAGFIAVAVALAQVQTTRTDFFGPGTQPNVNGSNTLHRSLISSGVCAGCHGYYDNEGAVESELYRPWAASMMGQSARDPIFYACLAIANQDAAFVGELCLRCHTPMGWYRGHSDDPTGAQLADVDFEGVSCSICHRAVDPIFTPDNPPEDFYIFNPPIPDRPAGTNPHTPPVPVPTGVVNGFTVPLNHNTSLVLDPLDRRRGPFELTINPHGWLQSTYHRDPALCANCHEVSNPAYSKQSDGTYRANALDAPHPTLNKFDMFPIERTYSEWLNSDFATAVQYLPLNAYATENDPEYGLNRFGGAQLYVQTCQDCHMPKAKSTGCDPIFGTPLRTDYPKHVFNGANTWVLRAVHTLFNPDDTGLEDQTVNESVARAQNMLRQASDMVLARDGDTLTVRIINRIGHKLPTGYPEGRRMWLNLRCFNDAGQLIEERGAYDPITARLTTADTKVYEAKLGLDAYAAQLTGKPEGESFHFAINNTWKLDNRIPPKGFTNAKFAAVQAAPVNYSYADGQHWDDTTFTLPASTARVEARLFHQVTTKEYIEFLRDMNLTNTAGQVAYDQWVLHGKATPTEMDFQTLDLNNPRVCDSIDFNNDGQFFDITDVDAFFSVYGEGPCVPEIATCNDIDFNNDGQMYDPIDVDSFLSVFSEGPCF